MASTSPAKPAGMFRGDADGLLDALVEACQSHKPKNVLPDEVLCRELTPFAFFEGENPVAGPSKPAQRGVKHGKNSPTLSPQRAKGARTSKSSSPASATPKSAERFKDAALVAPVPGPSTPPAASPRPMTNASHVKAGKAAAACPGFFSSPKPETLPTPSLLLLARAAPRAMPAVSMAQPMAIAAA